MEQAEVISCRGVRTHNLKNIDIDIPLKKWTAITGVSGSGKSSLVFHTLYAEAQRRFIETLGTYERQFLQGLPEGEFDSIHNLPAAIALKQTHRLSDSRSTISTASDLSVPLQIIFLSLMEPSCLKCGNSVIIQSYKDLLIFFEEQHKKTHSKNFVLTVEFELPNNPDSQKKILGDMLKEGYTRLIFENNVHEISEFDINFLTKNNTIEMVLDRIYNDIEPEELENRISNIWSQVRFSQRFYQILVKEIEESGTIAQKHRSFYVQPFCEQCNKATTLIQAHDLDFQSNSGIKNARCHNTYFTDLFEQEIHRTLDWTLSLKDEPQFAKKLNALNETYNEVVKKLNILVKLGLGTAHLLRRCQTLSGGEYQRVLLSRVIGNGLSDALYVLDEPSVGLGREEVLAMIECVKELRDLGNTILMVEHDKLLVNSADKIFELGPSGGHNGGHLLEFEDQPHSFQLNIGYSPFSNPEIISDEKLFEKDNSIYLKGFTALNCNNLNVEILLGKLNLITGPSGAGKSTLLNYGLRAALEKFEQTGIKDNTFFDTELKRGIWKALQVPKNFLDDYHLVNVKQSAAHRSIVSVPATYLGLMDIFRKHFSQTTTAKAMGLTPSEFSFNGRGGCVTCQGKGIIEEDLFFLGAVEKQCPDCHGMRYKKTSLNVTWLDKTIQEWLALSINEALPLLSKYPGFGKPLVLAKNLGLGYLPLGISTSSLSGGEMQRLRICASLSSKVNKKLFCLLDEPSRGLSEFDVGNLIESLVRLTHTGHTFVIVEHHELFKHYTHHILKLGPGGGVDGGRLIERTIYKHVD